MPKLQKRFCEFEISLVVQKLSDKSRIKKMENSVLGADYIQIHRQPMLRLFFRKNFLVIYRVCIAQVIPRRIHKSIQSFRVALGLAATLGAFHVDELFRTRKRRKSSST